MSAAPSLLDALVPRWDVRERHRLRVRAPAARVYAALRTADLGGHPLVRALLAARLLPAALARGRAGLRDLRARGAEPATLAAFERQGFRVLAEDPPREMVIGLQGAFWTPTGRLEPMDAAAFRAPVPAGVARAGWSFRVTEESGGTCLLETETRVLAGPGAGPRFRLYWSVIRPGSGIIRRVMLGSIRRQAERAPH